MTTTYRTALVGLSWISADPAPPASDPVLGTAIPISHAAAMAAIPSIDVVAACDVVPEARAAFTERWAWRWPNARLYSNFTELFAAERVDVASIITPDHLHLASVKAAISGGARAIFCEKPIATGLEDARELIETVERAGAVMTVDYTRRWMPEFVEARRVVRAGAIGPLQTVLVGFGGPRAMLFRNHSHSIDLMSYFAESAPAWVMGDLEPGFEAYGTGYKGDGGRDPSTEPGINAYVVYENGVRAFLTGMKNTPSEVTVHLLGPDGRITIDSQGLRVVVNERQVSRSPVPGASGPRVAYLTPDFSVAGIQAAVLDLVEALETGRPTQSTPETAWHAVSITDAILRSQAGGNVPVRPEPLHR